MSRYWNTGTHYGQPISGGTETKISGKPKRGKSQKGKRLHPIVIEGRAIAKSWWGKAWCDNLEKYADYQSRLGRESDTFGMAP